MIRDPCWCVCLAGVSLEIAAVLQLMAQALQYNLHEASGRCTAKPSLPVKHATGSRNVGCFDRAGTIKGERLALASTRVSV